jgi:hypothetical protein
VLHRFQIPDLYKFQIPDLRRFQIPDLCRFQSIILKWIADSREEARFGYRFRTLLENPKNT